MSTRLVVSTLSALALCAGAFAQDAPPPADRKVQYSPYPQQNFPNRVFFGDTHLHTSYSTDAGMIGNRLGPEEAYRFARGETVKSSTGLPARLSRPLDFLVVSDHAENLGLAPMIAESNPELLKSEFGRKMHELVKGGKGFAGVRRLGCGDDRSPGSAQGDADGAHGVGAHHRCSRKIQRAGSLHRVHRLRMDVGARAATICIATSFIATPRTRPTRSCRSRNTTASMSRISGNGWPTTRKRPAAGCLPSRTTAISPMGSCSTTSRSRPGSRSIATMRCGARSGSRCTK